jgi:tetratricopeptide (TPR) repeat protein
MRLNRGQHPDFGKEVREAPKHHRPRAINLPILGETSVRAVSGTGVFVSVLIWWLTPWAPIVVRTEERENLSVVLGREIETVVLMLADAQLVVPHHPVCPTAAVTLAAGISAGDGPYLLGQKATVEGRYDDARALLNAALAGEHAEQDEIHLALAQNELFAGKYLEAATQYDQVLRARPLDSRLCSQAAVAWSHAGNYERAEVLAKAAVTLSEQHKDSEDSHLRDLRATCLHVQAAVFICRGKEFDKAGQYNKQAQDVWKESLQESTAYAASVNSQAVLFQLLAKYPGAQNNQNLAYATWIQHLGGRHPYVAVSRSNLAMLYYVEGRYDDAQRVVEQVVRLRREILPPTHPAQAVGLNLSALVDLASGGYRNGLSKSRQALEILERNLPPQHPLVAAAARSVGNLYQALARYRRAEYYYYRMAEISQSVLGVDHPYFAFSLNRVGSLYLADGRYDEAQSQVEFALKTDERTLRDDHPAVASDLCLLAEVMHRANRAKDARPMLERALGIQQAAFLEQHPDIALTQAELAALDNNPATYAQGVSLYEQAMKTDEMLLGNRHPMVAQLCCGLGRLYLDQGKYTEAEKQVKRCIDIRKAALVPYHPQLAEALELYAEVLRKRNPDDKKAIERLLEEATQIRNEHADINAEDSQSPGDPGA